MSCRDQEFTLVDGIQLDPEPNGEAMIYWDGRIHKLGSTTALLSSVDILKLSTGAILRLLARYSVDKVTWYKLGTDGFIDGTATGLDQVSDDAPYQYQFTCDPKYFANYVQFGVQVEVGAARATAKVRALAVAQPQTIMKQTSAIGTTALDIWTARDVSAFDQAIVQVNLTTALGAGENLVITVYAIAEDAVWGTVRTPLASERMDNTAYPQYLSIQLTGLPQRLEIKAQRGDATSTSTATCAVQLRASR